MSIAYSIDSLLVRICLFHDALLLINIILLLNIYFKTLNIKHKTLNALGIKPSKKNSKHFVFVHFLRFLTANKSKVYKTKTRELELRSCVQVRVQVCVCLSVYIENSLKRTRLKELFKPQKEKQITSAQLSLCLKRLRNK